MPLYKLLRKSDHLSWTTEAREALDRIKVFLNLSLDLVAPKLGETLLYVATTAQVVSVALVVERESEGHVLKVQRLVYFVGEVLIEYKARYPQIQKLLYVVLIAK
jgi:hypothetical protein